MWDNRLWKGEILCKGLYSLACSSNAVMQDFDWHLTRIYGPNSRRERLTMWEEIRAVRGLCDDLWGLKFPQIHFRKEKCQFFNKRHIST